MNASTYNPGTTGGRRESLDGMITLLEPEERPFSSSIQKKSDVKSTFHEVVADTLRAPRTSGSREGSAGTKGGNKVAKRARFGSYLHRFHDTFGTTDVQQAVAKAGGQVGTQDEYDYASGKTLREVLRDMEAAHCGTQDTSAGGEDTDMVERGAFKWITATQTPQIPTSYLAPANQRLTGVSTLAASNLDTVLQSIITSYGKPPSLDFYAGNTYVANIDNLSRVDTTSGAITRVVQDLGKSRELNFSVRVYKTSFGVLNVFPSQFIAVSSGVGDVDSGLVINPELWETQVLEDIFVEEDPDSGGADGRHGFVKAIAGLFCRMPKGNASISN